MPRKHKPKTRIHLGYARFEVKRFPTGILSALPIVKHEIRLANTGRDYSKAKNNTTSRCIRTRSDNVLRAAISKSKILGPQGLARGQGG